MKKAIFVALALVASASFSPVEAGKKKTAAVVEEKVQLANSSDSVSYAAGMWQRASVQPLIT